MYLVRFSMLIAGLKHYQEVQEYTNSDAVN